MTITRSFSLILLLALVVSVTKIGADEPKPATPPAAAAPSTEPELTQEQLEKRFEELLTGAQLVGVFTTNDAPGDKPPNADKYTINKIKKLDNGYWLFDATIQYGGNNTRIPISLPVKWAGDTPVISVTNVLVPGMGTFSARVLFYNDQYAGTWSGSNHGGHMYGRVVKAAAGDESKQTKNSQPAGTKSINN